MLEVGAVLRTWALPQPPVAVDPTAAVRLPAELLADHRLEYLEKDGPVSGGRGTVRRWDAGTYELAHDELSADDGNRLVVDLLGAKVRGRVVLSMASQDHAADDNKEQGE